MASTISRLFAETATVRSSLARTFATGTRQVRLRKHHKGRMKGFAVRGSTVSFGDFALQALESSWVTARQIEAGRRAVQRSIGKTGKVWVRLIADKSVTEKPIGVRMGSGKGAVQYTVAVVKPGRMLFEVGGVPENVAKKGIALAAAKMPIKTAFRTRGICSLASSQLQTSSRLNLAERVSPLLLPKLFQSLDLNK